MRTVLRDPGEPLASTVTPGTETSSRWSTLALVCLSTVSILALATAPVMSARRCSPYAVTTISSRKAMGAIVTLIVERPAIVSWTPRWPSSVKLRRPCAGAAAMEYLPFASVTTRVGVPWTCTATPRRGIPPALVTVPETGICWPNAGTLNPSASSRLIPTARSRRGWLFRNECLTGRIFSMAILPVAHTNR